MDESGFFTFPPGASRADLREEGQSMFEVARVAGDSQARFRCALFIFFFFYFFFFFSFGAICRTCKSAGDKRQLKSGHQDMEAPIKLGMWAYMRGGRWRRESAAMQIHFSIYFFYSRMKDTQENQGG